MPTRNHKKSASNFGKRNGGKRVQSCKAVSTGLDSHSSVYNLRSHARSPLDSSEPSKTKAAPIPKKTETSIAWTKKTNLDSPRYLAPPPEAYCIYSKTAALIDSLNVDDPGHQSRVVNYIKSTSIDPYDKKFILEYVRDPRSYVVNPTDSVDRQRHKLDLRDYTVFEITKGAECSINLWVTTAIATDPKYFFRWDGPDTREQLGPIRFHKGSNKSQPHSESPECPYNAHLGYVNHTVVNSSKSAKRPLSPDDSYTDCYIQPRSFQKSDNELSNCSLAKQSEDNVTWVLASDFIIDPQLLQPLQNPYEHAKNQSGNYRHESALSSPIASERQASWDESKPSIRQATWDEYKPSIRQATWEEIKPSINSLNGSIASSKSMTGSKESLLSSQTALGDIDDDEMDSVDVRDEDDRKKINQLKKAFPALRHHFKAAPKVNALKHSKQAELQDKVKEEEEEVGVVNGKVRKSGGARELVWSSEDEKEGDIFDEVKEDLKEQIFGIGVQTTKAVAKLMKMIPKASKEKAKKVKEELKEEIEKKIKYSELFIDNKF
ncbi:hypothetical protein MJO28_008077 [Puccinia striiformis f. sp. tritici]|uniref:Uncharacterized protein n=4 Tax=Puccinia striiformis TaxID=27350 RepID=A0A2S4UIP5_9BASI|nr:hypothetical protein MJO29_017024 [Puccinia striiformis f. sp. tritici]KAI7949256.1 hypothetical protein MJO28_008077 [Puccinia striiformis f. sp. tritici]KNE94886.1 hypothetical protein PSTG_11787 [Puccinia striiformis f. sp. tritici PST-78]POV97188.1 hypothetical protein PSTT_15230 [Puccinia striiformis]POW03575.1 hypothetical protein PSTT_10968 [Puccinia striiformis]